MLVFGRNFFSPRETTIKRFQVADAVTWIRGTHSLKAGVRPQLRQHLQLLPRQLRRPLHVQLRRQPRPRPAQRVGRELPAGLRGSGHDGAGRRIPTSRSTRSSSRTSGRPRASSPSASACATTCRTSRSPTCATPTPSSRPRGSTPASSTSTRTTSRLASASPSPRTRRRWCAAATASSTAARPSIMIGTAPQRQRDQRPDHHLHGRAGAEVPGRLHDHPHRGGPAAALHPVLRSRFREPGGAPGQRRRRARRSARTCRSR